MSAFNLTLLIILLIATLADLLLPFLLATKYFRYNHLKQTISTLGNSHSPVKKQQHLSMLVIGLLLLIFALGQNKLLLEHHWASNLYSLGISFFAIGCLFAAFFPEDPEKSIETTTGKIHGITSGLGFLFLLFCPFWALWIKEFNSLRILNTILFLLGLLSFSFFIFSEKKKKGFLQYSGLFQRINLLILYAALIANFIKLALI